MSGAICQPMPGRLATYRVVVAGDRVLGLIRLDVSARQWIARTSGSETTASCLRKFDDRTAAVAWLQEREPASAEAVWSPNSSPGRRRAVA
jgi:hypothetical protein